MDLLLYLVFMIVCSIVFTAYQEYKKQTRKKYDPFSLRDMLSLYKCTECKSQYHKPFKKNEYAYQEITYFCPKCKKMVTCVILGSFAVPITTIQGLKREREAEKWYTESENKWKR